MKIENVRIESSWKSVLKEEFTKTYFLKIKEYLLNAKAENKILYPKGKNIFKAFDLVPFSKVKVVILGQDPYHNPGEAMGLSFSVPKDKKIPPSLRNIYKELKNDLDCSIPEHGDLSFWAQQGVFLLNAMLTVEHKKAGSHRNIGWQEFTNAVIRTLSWQRKGLVFFTLG